MTVPLSLFLALTLASSILVILYVASVRLVASRVSPFPRRAIVPLLTPVHTWRLGARALTVATASTALLYALLWLAVALGGVW